MGAVATGFTAAFRDYATDGVPSSGAFAVVKSAVRALGATIEAGAFPAAIAVGGATPAASGAGVTFPATQSASSDANTLDDYEEGTWTPAVGGSATYTNQTGTYTKIGRQVFVSMLLTINAIGSGSTHTVSGLPFASAIYAPLSIGYNASLAVAPVSVGAYIAASGSSIVMIGRTAANASVTDMLAVFGNAARVDAAGVYSV